MRAKEFIFEAEFKSPAPMSIPEPDSVDPKGVTDPKAPGKLIDQMTNISNMPVPSMKEAELDPKGWGETPMGTDVDYFGLQVKMRPSTFLKLSHPLGSSESNPEVEKHMQSGGKIAYPFLEIKDPIEWEEGDFSELGKVVNHEGRNRMTHWIKMKGDDPIQINLFLRGANRRKYITDDMIQALSQGLISQTGQLIRNPFDASTALEETLTGTRWTGDELYRKLV